jgi:hypothetical protein
MTNQCRYVFILVVPARAVRPQELFNAVKRILDNTGRSTDRRQT